MPRFSIVVAADEAGGIGKDGKLPWHLKGDLAYFKRLTQEPPSPHTVNAVIMGRKTWDSIPNQFRPLPGRRNVVISKNRGLLLPDEVIRAHSLDHALARVAATDRLGKVFVIGGGQIFREAIAHRDLEAIYLTRIHAVFECDTHFPAIPSTFARVSTLATETDGPLTYDFCVLR